MPAPRAVRVVAARAAACQHQAMPALEMRVFELLTARLCHELIGPVAAIGNGVELLLEEPLDPDQEALALVAESARRTSSRLQFYRFAYGFGGEGAAAGPSPSELAASYFETTAISCDCRQGFRTLAPVLQKLGCNLVLVGAEALPRGGRLTVDAAGSGLHLEIAGEAVRLAPEQLEALALATPPEGLTARTVHAYFTGLLAQARGMRLAAVAVGPGRFDIRTA